MAIDYEDWIRDTYAFGKRRSLELKNVDEALRAYRQASYVGQKSDPARKKSLRTAFDAWKAKQKGNWLDSSRNSRKAVKTLADELDGLIHVGAFSPPATKGELDAFKVLAESIKKNTHQMFSGRRLSVRPDKVLADLDGVRSKLSIFKTAVSGIETWADRENSENDVRGMLAKLFDDAPLGEVHAALGPVLSEFVSNVAPFWGVIKSGSNAIIAFGQAAKGLYSQHQMAEGEYSFAPGDPASAFEAILKIQEREINKYLITGSTHAIAAATKGAFTMLDFGAISGPAFGAAETLALLVHQTYLFARDWNEMNSANKLLATEAYDLKLFKTCPLLGCYLIGNSDTSHIIHMAVGDYGKPGWMFEVEDMVQKAQPVFLKSRDVIRGSRFRIEGLEDRKGAAVDRNGKTLKIIPTGKINGISDDFSRSLNNVILKTNQVRPG